MITIRQAVAPDANAIGDMMRRLWPCEDPHAFDTDLACLTSHPTEQEPAAIYVAEAEGRLIGFVSLGTREWAEGVEISPVGYVEGWFVAEDWRRRGVGRRLLTEAEAWARSHQFAALASDVEQQNLPSIEGHLSAGFQESARLVYFVKKL